LLKNIINELSGEKTLRKYLDILRGFAITGVVLVHSVVHTDNYLNRNNSDLNSGLFTLGMSGKYGVEVFFFLSGVLLTEVYNLNKKKINRNYWKRRLARIYPLWLIFLIIAFLKGSIFKVGGFYTAVQSDEKFYSNPMVIIFLGFFFMFWVSPILYNFIIPGAWSIQAEVFNYIMFPIIRKYGFRNSLVLLLFMNFMSIFINLFDTSKINNQYFFEIFLLVNPIASLNYFIFGIFFHRIIFGLRSKIEISILIIILCLLMLMPLNYGSNMEAVFYLAINAFFAWKIINTNLAKSIIFIGKHSYFIYFFHFIFLDFLSHILNRMPFVSIFPNGILLISVFLSALLVSLVFGIISMKYIEGPIIKRFR
jgi:peptidoglycan/LPS O-acetylase OafA/YrhL